MSLNRYRVGALLAVACVIAAALAVAFAGSGGDANLVSGSAVADAASATESVPGASVSLNASVTVDGVAKPLLVRMTGVQDVRGHSARMAGYYSNLPQKVPGALPDGRVPIATIGLLPRIYLKSPLFAAALPKGKEWLSEDVAAVGKKLGIGDPSQFGQGDPMQFLRYLRATGSKVKRVGSERVRGVATTHYSATVELKRLPDLLPAGQRAAARASMARLTKLIGSDSYPAEAWVDAHHLVRRTRLVMKLKVPQTDKTMTMDMTMEMFDFGPKQRAKAPPADATFDITKQAAGAVSNP